MQEPTAQEIKTSQLWRQMGLTDTEYEQICDFLGRNPNYTELGMYAVLWSEHCAYKHTRPFFKRFPTEGKRILQGPGENAGVVDIGDGWAAVFKVESHNHPSAIEPYHGAATGVGGILRDIFTMGARPVAILNSLRFGSLEDERVKFLLKGVAAGMADYGNTVGVPTVAGEVYFDQAYAGNPLVNAMAVGLVRHETITTATASGVGNPVMVVGAATGRDGIHGATFASGEFDGGEEGHHSSVAIGDPATEKLLIEACLEVIASDLIVGIQDMGAAGLTSSACEMASRAGSGIEMDVSLVPRREPGMTAYEIMLSESQERMLLVPKKGAEEEVKAIFDRYGLPAVVIGKVTADGMVRVYDGDQLAADVPAKSLTEGAPCYIREGRQPAYLEHTRDFDAASLPLQTEYNGELLRLLDSPTIASKRWIYQQFDHSLGRNTVVGPGVADAAVLQVEGTNRGIAVTIDGNGRYTYLDPYHGAMGAVAEAARNLVCTGAEPIGLTDGLNFGNPEKPEVYWQLEEAINGIAAAARFLEIPVTGGNASLYNESGGQAIYPTPVIGMVGLLEEVTLQTTSAFQSADDVIALLGWPGFELGGSEYLQLKMAAALGLPPQIDLHKEKSLQQACLAAIKAGLVKSAHDVSEGGIAVALAESCIQGKVGATIRLPWAERPDVVLFSESAARIVLSVNPEKVRALEKLATQFAVPITLLGTVGSSDLQIFVTDQEQPVVSQKVADLAGVWETALERRLG